MKSTWRREREKILTGIMKKK